MNFELKIDFELNQGDEILHDVFIKNEDTSAVVTNNINNPFIGLNEIPEPTKFVCISSNVLSREIIEFCKQHSNRGINIYVMLNDAEINKSAIAELAGLCLIRTGVLQHGSIILFDGNTSKANLFFSPVDNFESLVFIKTDAYAKQVYETFCHVFWKKTKQEYRKQFGGPKDCSECSAIGDLHLSDLYSIQPSLIKETFLDSRNFNLFLQAENFIQFESLISQCAEVDQLYFNIKQSSNSVVNSSTSCLKAKKAFLTELPKMDCNLIFNSKYYFVLPKFFNESADVNWLIVDKKICAVIFDNLNVKYEFKNEIKIKNLEENSDLYFSDNILKKYTTQIPNSQKLVLYAESIEDYLRIKDSNDSEAILISSYPDTFSFNREFVASFVPYSVSFYPPLLPQNSKVDSLVTQWAEIQKNWIQKLEGLEKRIEINEKNISGWDKSISEKLKLFILGTNQKNSEWKDEIKSLKKIDLGKTPPGLRSQKTENFKKLDDSISKYINETNNRKKSAENEIKLNKERDSLVEKINSVQKMISLEKDNKKIEGYEKNLARLKNDLEKLNTSFTNSSSNDELKSLLGGISSEKTGMFKDPDEYLPLTDTQLYTNEGMRFLLIHTLNDIALVKKDAERLNAIICIKGE